MTVTRLIFVTLLTLLSTERRDAEKRSPFDWAPRVENGRAHREREGRQGHGLHPAHQNDKFQGAAGEGVAVDSDGNVYAAEGPTSRPFSKGGLTKYLKKQASGSGLPGPETALSPEARPLRPAASCQRSFIQRHQLAPGSLGIGPVVDRLAGLRGHVRHAPAV